MEIRIILMYKWRMATRETFIFFPPPRPDRPCAPTLAGTSWCQGDYRIERTAPRHAVLEYIENGSGTVTVSGRTLRPVAGDFYLLLPGPDHAYGSSADDPWVKHWFNVAGTLIPALADVYGIRDVVHFPGCAVGPLFAKGHAMARKDPGGCADGLGRLFHEILQTAAKVRQARDPSSQPKDDPSMQKILRHLEAHWRENVALEDLADLVGLSRAQMVRRFRAATGAPPHQWVLRRRLDQAQNLLQHTGLPVKAVAHLTGFEDPYHFAALFKRHVGRSPGSWRRWRAGMREPAMSGPEET